jgi:hypothetical protein
MAAGDPPRRRTRRMLLSFLWPLGIGDRETAQAESVTTAAVRASQHRQNCATSVACRLLRISTREAVRIVRAHASPLLPLCLLVDAISDVFWPQCEPCRCRAPSPSTPGAPAFGAGPGRALLYSAAGSARPEGARRHHGQTRTS